MGTDFFGTVFANELFVRRGFGMEVYQADRRVERRDADGGQPVLNAECAAAEVRLDERVIDDVQDAEDGNREGGQQLLVTPQVAAEESLALAADEQQVHELAEYQGDVREDAGLQIGPEIGGEI